MVRDSWGKIGPIESGKNRKDVHAEFHLIVILVVIVQTAIKPPTTEFIIQTDQICHRHSLHLNFGILRY
jgi:hypothetical protein